MRICVVNIMTKEYEQIAGRMLKAYRYMMRKDISLNQKRKLYEEYDKCGAPIEAWIKTHDPYERKSFYEWFDARLQDIDEEMSK